MTNDKTQDNTQAAQEVCGVRWKIAARPVGEQFHREAKPKVQPISGPFRGHRAARPLGQVTGLEMCQCRLERIQRNHIACALIVWMRLKPQVQPISGPFRGHRAARPVGQVAEETGRTIYQVKHGLLDDYMCQFLRDPPHKNGFCVSPKDTLGLTGSTACRPIPKNQRIYPGVERLPHICAHRRPIHRARINPGACVAFFGDDLDHQICGTDVQA